MISRTGESHNLRNFACVDSERVDALQLILAWLLSFQHDRSVGVLGHGKLFSFAGPRLFLGLYYRETQVTIGVNITTRLMDGGRLSI